MHNLYERIRTAFDLQSGIAHPAPLALFFYQKNKLHFERTTAIVGGYTITKFCISGVLGVGRIPDCLQKVRRGPEFLARQECAHPFLDQAMLLFPAIAMKLG